MRARAIAGDRGRETLAQPVFTYKVRTEACDMLLFRTKVHKLNFLCAKKDLVENTVEPLHHGHLRDEETSLHTAGAPACVQPLLPSFLRGGAAVHRLPSVQEI